MASFNRFMLGKSILSSGVLRISFCDGFTNTGPLRNVLTSVRSQNSVCTQCVQGRVFLHKNIKLQFRRCKSSESPKRPNVKRSDLKRLLSFAVSEKYKLLGATALLTVSSATSLVLPFGIGRIIDLIYTQSKEGNVLNSLGQLCVILLGVFVVGAIANFGRVYLMNVAGSRIINELRKKLFRSVSQQEMAFFDKTRTGELVNRLAADTGIIGQSVTTNVSDGLRSLFQATGGISLMVYMSPKLALISLGIVPPLFFLLRILGGYMRRLTTRVQDAWAASTQVAEEKLGNIRTVRAFAQEEKENAAFGSKVDDIQQLAYKEATARGIYWGSTQLAGNMMVLSVFYYGGKLMNEAQISVGDLTSFLLYAAFVGVSLSSLTTFYAELMRGLGASTRIFELLDKRPEIPTTGGLMPMQPVQGLVELHGVNFSYPSRPDIGVLRDFTLSVPSGSVMAIVGASGSGKSTVTSLLLRYYDPQAGNIKIDGHDITTVDPRWLRHNMGVVSQEPALFSCSIAENIAYGAIDPAGVPMADIVAAAKMANAHEFIERFPDKYNTIVGERGIMLSGGQKQRVAIARAIIKNPKILLLDEATSALDAESEYLVQEALERAVVDRTVITIAHRLSTIKNASCIAVLDGGRIVELGKYDELRLRQNGVFRRLVERQAISITKA